MLSIYRLPIQNHFYLTGIFLQQTESWVGSTFRKEEERMGGESFEDGEERDQYQQEDPEFQPDRSKYAPSEVSCGHSQDCRDHPC